MNETLVQRVRSCCYIKKCCNFFERLMNLWAFNFFEEKNFDFTLKHRGCKVLGECIMPMSRKYFGQIFYTRHIHVFNSKVVNSPSACGFFIFLYKMLYLFYFILMKLIIFIFTEMNKHKHGKRNKINYNWWI